MATMDSNLQHAAGNSSSEQVTMDCLIQVIPATDSAVGSLTTFDMKSEPAGSLTQQDLGALT